jgi:hypothetical protein
MAIRITENDLDVAILWLESYEATGDDDEGQKQCQRVADWLKKELEERLVKKIMRDHKIKRALAEAVLARARAERTAEKV